ncbi:MAG TPA: VOC family protein [Rhizomicrobium sp.]|jgi:predicted 3-demethylubiquinone-9 3-methyltransferase (glyoxalase superfamily)|nr:VOC family protein [Rhizomicrobium sp.]
MQKIRPCLWFDGKAEDAAKFYISVFPNSKITDRMVHNEAGPGPKGSVLTVTFELDGQEYVALNGGPHYTFTPAISLFVTCETQDEVDRYWDKLLDGGSPVQCGWITDKFGVSWQIVPRVLGEMLQDKDSVRAARVMQAMFKMIKLDIAALKRAYDEKSANRP